MTTDPAGIVPDFTICDRLRKARELTGLDQAAFAREIGASRGTVSTYERDEEAAFRPGVLMLWSMRSGVSLEWLRTGIGAPNGPRPAGDGPSADTTKLDALTARKRSRARSNTQSGNTHRYSAAA